MFGGLSSTFGEPAALNDLWTFKQGTWVIIRLAEPTCVNTWFGCRYGHSMISIANKAYVQLNDRTTLCKCDITSNLCTALIARYVFGGRGTGSATPLPNLGVIELISNSLNAITLNTFTPSVRATYSHAATTNGA